MRVFHLRRGGGLLRTATVSDNANGKAGSQSAQPDGQARAELQEARVDGHFLVDLVGDDDADDEAVYGEDLGHDGT